MSVKRQSKRAVELDSDAESWLRGEPSGFHEFLAKQYLAEQWAEHRDRIVAEHVAAWPGTRPLRWWEYDAPEPRRRLGGTGTPLHEIQNYVASYWLGIPAFPPGAMPTYETQAAYLKRHGLLLAGERKRMLQAACSAKQNPAEAELCQFV